MLFTPYQTALLEKIKEFHGTQVRKYTQEPYWTHLVSVANIASEHLPQKNIIEIALCHDVLEDTPCTPEVLIKTLAAIGYSKEDQQYIVAGVIALTDEYTSEKYPKLNRKARKQKEAERLWKVDPVFQSIKYADLLDNTRSITKYDPGFARIYLQEKQYILEGMNKGNQELYKKCTETVYTKNSL